MHQSNQKKHADGSSTAHERPSTQTERGGATKPSGQGDKSRHDGKAPDMKSHKGAGSSSQEEMVRRSHEAGDQDIDEPMDQDMDEDVDEPAGEPDAHKRMSKARR